MHTVCRVIVLLTRNTVFLFVYVRIFFAPPLPTAVGPGCPDLPELKHGWTVYRVDGDQLVANATCNVGFYFHDKDQVDASYRTVTCVGYFWNGLLPECKRTFTINHHHL